VDAGAGRVDLERYLSGHGLHYSLHEVALEGRHVGGFLMDYAVGVDADLLVMGGYGHSRVQEFVLGGATRDVVTDPILPVLLSH
jgi:nucleotide-binding universal stress UspA family protein